jgi:hypothetical protein
VHLTRGTHPPVSRPCHAKQAAAFCQIGQGKERLLFVNKKKQKNFIDFGLWALSAKQNQAQHSKSFCAAFFKKRPLSLSRSRLEHGLLFVHKK